MDIIQPIVRIDVIATIPSLLTEFSKAAIIGRASEKKIIKINVHNLRDYASDKHKTIDDSPFGGGAGMVLKPEPLFKAIENIKQKSNSRIILFSPQGNIFNQKIASEFAEWSQTGENTKQILLICGRYEGIDERVIDYFKPLLISIGDYVISGGETAAMVFIEAVARLIKGVLGNEDSIKEESFSDNFIEYPHYTRPAEFRGLKVPEVLLSGNHSEIKKWRQKTMEARTKKVRPDLFKKR